MCVHNCMQDPSQYVLNQMEALEAEQNHIDTRAGVVERKLRQLLETGNVHDAQHVFQSETGE